MKHLISILALIAICFSATAQQGPTYVNKYFGEGTATNDTLTNAATLTFTLTEVLRGYGALHFGVEADSLSGSTAGTIRYQVSMVENPTADQWVTIATDVIDGVTDNDEYLATDFAAVRARIVIIGTGTQSTEVTPMLSFKRKF